MRNPHAMAAYLCFAFYSLFSAIVSSQRYVSSSSSVMVALFSLLLSNSSLLHSNPRHTSKILCVRLNFIHIRLPTLPIHDVHMMQTKHKSRSDCNLTYRSTQSQKKRDFIVQNYPSSRLDRTFGLLNFTFHNFFFVLQKHTKHYITQVVSLYF